MPLRIMGYARSFRFIRTHVICADRPSGELEHDRDQVYEALRAGRCYIAVDAVAPVRGFRFEADVLTLGGEAPAGRRTLHARTPLPARLRLLRNGREVASSDGTSLEHEVEEPGVYRIEARRRFRGRERTWILANPIYLR